MTKKLWTADHSFIFRRLVSLMVIIHKPCLDHSRLRSRCRQLAQLLTQHFSDGFIEHRQLVDDDIPHRVRIDPEIVVHKDVAKAGYSVPLISGRDSFASSESR
jgi:hypothetical protein